MKRPRGRFLLDTVRKPEGPADGCRKYSGHHSTLIPGLFTLFCGHGVCYGFSVMESSESVNIPFTILRTRFQTGVVIYDNAYKLHSNALKRDPEFFKTTWFLVDRLHWRNHSGCNCGYNADLYPQFSGVNTQIAEQFNSRLKRLKYHLPYMSPWKNIHCSKAAATLFKRHRLREKEAEPPIHASIDLRGDELDGDDELSEEQKEEISTLAMSWDLPPVSTVNRKWLYQKVLKHAN
ncbi:uncharacterized protein LOC121690319 [Alosa sapidissima]|uniref:uncharacterized protein LOC121690319 n=1 Tax=Alosa sapidissima TaxID=34773 RepID=UPI001C0A0B7C|nr:uncharacterized protein LOC121690319 [Alosa sapidissima]